VFIMKTRRTATLLIFFAVFAGIVATGCLPGGGLIPPQQVFVSLHLTGGIAFRDQTVVIRGDGSVETSGQFGGQPSTTTKRAMPGGEQAARDLRDRIVATGIYEVAPGEYLPSDPCCDRITYELTLERSGKAYRYVTMDATETAPRPLLAALTAIQEAILSAQ
jgi:hypothetical protein